MGRGRRNTRGERGRRGGRRRRRGKERGGRCSLLYGDGSGSIIITIMRDLPALCRSIGGVKRQDLVALLEEIAPEVQECAVQVAKDAAWGSRWW